MADDHIAALAGLRFSDVPNWRNRETAIGDRRAPIDPKFEQFPASPNVDDRRGEALPWLAQLMKEYIGFTPEQLSKAWSQVNSTPYVSGDQLRDKWITPRTNDPLSASAGYNDIPLGPPRGSLPWWRAQTKE